MAVSSTSFIDRLKIYVAAGDGGNGAASFRRAKFIPKGGPDGGDGGDGGNVYLRASKDINNFLKLSHHPHWKADSGGNGMGNQMTGRRGEDVYIPVPMGTIVYEIKDDSRTLVTELLEDGQEYLIAKGGHGGRGNIHFKSSINRAPRRRETGWPGEKKALDLELKLLANVGLVGFPNAGKSTLLSRLTNAKPKVAAYPFTTLAPILGAGEWKGRTYVIADIPGLIEGAHTGKGLGDEFLRHVERTKILLHLVDPEGFSGIPPLESVRSIERELKLWSKELAAKPRILVVTKKDLGPQAEKLAAALRKRKSRIRVLAVSSQTGEGLDLLQNAIIEKL